MLTDALFLDSVAKVLEMGTSEIFLSHVRKFSERVWWSSQKREETYWKQTVNLGTLQSVIVDYSFTSFVV